MPDHEDIQIVWRRPRPLQVARSPRTEDQHLLRAMQPGEFIGHDLQRPPREEQQLSQRLNKAVACVRLDHSRSPDAATTQQASTSQALHLAVNRAERCIEPPSKICQAVLLFRVEQQRSKDVSLQLRPEYR